jgi:hypothetical protein
VYHQRCDKQAHLLQKLMMDILEKRVNTQGKISHWKSSYQKNDEERKTAEARVIAAVADLEVRCTHSPGVLGLNSR